jgi:signal peptide peptidase SppA
MKFQRVIEQVFYRPWLITPGGYAAVRKLVEGRVLRANGEGYEMLDGMTSKREEMEIDGQGIAHISIEGTLAKGISPIEACCGAWDYEWITEDIEDAIEANVRGIMLEINSPGGNCTGCSEVVDMIQGLTVPIVAYSDDTACSAAYNIAVSCDKVIGSVGSTWGSIGTIIPWLDQSAAYEAEGLRWDPITSGPLKGAGMGPSLTPAQRASLQQLVDDSFAQFRDNVLRNRRVADEYMTGAAYLAPRARMGNLIDAVGTEELAYSELLRMVGA